MDIHVEVPPVSFRDLSTPNGGRSSAEILRRVKGARQIQADRFKRMKVHTNAKMTSRHVRQFCAVNSEANELLERAMEKLGLSARAHSRILKISRTIADLENSPDIEPYHVAEAIQYRSLDRRVFG
jgi:magnesium chelatase family protein